MKKFLLILMILITAGVDASAQCAMCRSTLENNLSNGDPSLAAGLNVGILYLLALPYLAVMIIGYLWFKSSRNGRKEQIGRIA